MKGASKGVQFNDRVLAGNLRTKIMEEIFLVVNEDVKVTKWSAFKKQMLLVLARTILPRLNEVTGQDGGPLIVQLPGVITKKNGIDAKPGANS